MINFTTQKEYQGSNIDELLATGYPMGSQFCTFRSLIKIFLFL